MWPLALQAAAVHARASSSAGFQRFASKTSRHAARSRSRRRPAPSSTWPRCFRAGLSNARSRESERLGLFDLAAVESVLRANHRRPGTAKLRAVLQEHRVGTTLTRSELEEHLLVLCDRYGLERPLVNVPLLGFEVDFLWPAARVVVETDGHASHGTRAAFERDRARDAHLTAAGFRVVGSLTDS